MSTSAEVIAAWQSSVFANAAVTAITNKIHVWDAAADIADLKDFSLLMCAQQINFFTFIVSRTRVNAEVRGAGTPSRYDFRAVLSYFRQKDPGQTDHNFNAVAAALETVDGLVVSAIGKRWGNTVDFYSMAGIQETQLVKIKDTSVWRGAYEYRAQQQI